LSPKAYIDINVITFLHYLTWANGLLLQCIVFLVCCDCINNVFVWRELPIHYKWVNSNKHFTNRYFLSCQIQSLNNLKRSAVRPANCKK